MLLEDIRPIQNRAGTFSVPKAGDGVSEGLLQNGKFEGDYALDDDAAPFDCVQEDDSVAQGSRRRKRRGGKRKEASKKQDNSPLLLPGAMPQNDSDTLDKGTLVQPPANGSRHTEGGPRPDKGPARPSHSKQHLLLVGVGAEGGVSGEPAHQPGGRPSSSSRWHEPSLQSKR